MSFNWIVIGSGNGLSPVQCKNHPNLLSMEPLGTNSNLIKIQTFSLKKMHLKVLSTKWKLFVCLNMLTHYEQNLD